jgi:hypothetical protein
LGYDGVNPMKRLAVVLAIVVATALGLAIFTDYEPGTLDARTVVLGLPIVSVRQTGAHGWLALGQSGSGVLVIAQAGAGVVAIVQVGAAVLFGIGQLMGSLVAIGQLGFGVFGYVGQVGVGIQATGQGVARRLPKEDALAIGRELDELLSWNGSA